MIVSGDTGFLKLACFLVAQLTQGDADLHAELADFADCLQHRLKTAVARFDPFPRCAHTKAGGAVFTGLPGKWHHIFAAHEFLGFDSRLVTGALSTVRTVLATTTRLDTK